MNASSVAAANGGIIGPRYAAPKAGLLASRGGHARQLAGEGITVNAVVPGLVATEMIEGTAASEDAVPVGRFGTPEVAVVVVRTLAENGYITGQTTDVDGGIRFD